MFCFYGLVVALLKFNVFSRKIFFSFSGFSLDKTYLWGDMETNKIQSNLHSIKASNRKIYGLRLFWRSLSRNPKYLWGRGSFFYLKVNMYILKYATCEGINNRFEFYSLWLLLKCVANRETERVQVMGDSKLLMDWANDKIRIENMGLGPIMLRVSMR